MYQYNENCTLCAVLIASTTLRKKLGCLGSFMFVRHIFAINISKTTTKIVVASRYIVRLSEFFFLFFFFFEWVSVIFHNLASQSWLITWRQLTILRKHSKAGWVAVGGTSGRDKRSHVWLNRYLPPPPRLARANHNRRCSRVFGSWSNEEVSWIFRLKCRVARTAEPNLPDSSGSDWWTPSSHLKVVQTRNLSRILPALAECYC